MTRRSAALATIAAAASLTLVAGLAGGTAAAAGKLARVVEVIPSSTFHVNTTNGVYSGSMVREHTRAGLGGGSVPKGMSTTARHACYRLYAAGPANGLVPHVRLLWYRKSYGPGAAPAIANFGTAPTHFDTSGNWTTGGLYSPSIANGDKFTATGGFWDSGLQRYNTTVDTKATYKGHRLRVECDAFMATGYWPF